MDGDGSWCAAPQSERRSRTSLPEPVIRQVPFCMSGAGVILVHPGPTPGFLSPSQPATFILSTFATLSRRARSLVEDRRCMEGVEGVEGYKDGMRKEFVRLRSGTLSYGPGNLF